MYGDQKQVNWGIPWILNDEIAHQTVVVLHSFMCMVKRIDLTVVVHWAHTAQQLVTLSPLTVCTSTCAPCLTSSRRMSLLSNIQAVSRAFLPPSSFSPNTSCSCVSSAKPSRSKCALMLSKSPQSTQSNISFCIDVILHTVSEANLHWNLPLPWLQDSTTRLWRARQN